MYTPTLSVDDMPAEINESTILAIEGGPESLTLTPIFSYNVILKEPQNV